MSQLYSAKKFDNYGGGFHPDAKKDYEKAYKKGQDILGRLGQTKAPKGYAQTGTRTIRNKAGERTYAIYSKVAASQPQQSQQQQQQQQNREETSSQPTGTATSMPQSYWQNQITKLMGPITSQQQAEGEAAGAKQAAFDQRLADLTAGFDTQTAQLTSGFQSQMEAANAARQQEIEGIMAANKEQMGMLQTQQAERIQAMEASQAKLMAEQEARVQQMQIAQQTQAANAARAGQTGQFRVGGDRAVGGIGQFKRRLQIKPVASGALSLAGSPTRSSNKMLNV